MLDLNALGPTGRLLYARSLAGALASGLSPVQAEAIAKDALVKAGLVAVMKAQGEPVRVLKRIEAKPAPTEAELAQSFLDVYAARKAADPRARPGDLHSAISREYPALAAAYRDSLTAR